MSFEKQRESGFLIGTRRAPLLLILLSALVQSCGDGGGDGFLTPGQPLADSQQIPGTDPFPTLALNGDLRGRVFESGDAEYIDLETGERVQLAGDSAYPSRDGLEVVELYEDFRFLPDGGCFNFSSWNDRIVIRNAISGREADSFEIPNDISGPIKLSPDGQTIAAVWNKAHTCSNEDTTLSVFSRQGEEIIRGVEGIRTYDWLPDNRLVFVLDQTIYVETERNTLRIRTVADMSNVPGTPSRVSVSPDGSQVLFEMVTGNSLFLSSVRYRDATVWTVNIDGTGLRRLASTSRTDDSGQTIADPQVNMPVWSPDGNDFLVTEDFTSGGFVLTGPGSVVVDFLPVSNAGLTYVLKNDSAEQQLPPQAYSSTGVRPLLGTNLDGQPSVLAISPFDVVMWTPPVTRAEVINGSLPAFNGRANRGVGGDLMYLDKDDNDQITLFAMNLSAGASRTQTTFNDPLDDRRSTFMGMSADGSLTAHHAKESLDEQFLKIYNNTGLLIENLAFITNNYHYEPESALRFSPTNNEQIGWIYDDDDFGTGAIVLNWSSRIFEAIYSTRDYDALAWTNEGDLLLIDEGLVYLSEVQGDEFSNARLLYDFGAPIENPSISPVNNDMAFSSGGQIFIVDLDGSNVRRVVAPSDGAAHTPFWSPDGNSLVVSRGFDQFIVAADALNARLYDDFKSVGGMQLSESASNTIPAGSTLVGWR